MSKRYYWLKLKEDFFNSDDMKIIKAQKNGSDYIIFWQQLLLKSISQNDIGLLRYKENIPYTPEILATVTDTNIDIVKGALAIFKKLGMIDINGDGDILIDEIIHDLIGSEVDSAERVRKHRAKKKALHGNKRKQISNTEIEIEEDIDKEIEKEKKYFNRSNIIKIWNDNILGIIPKIEEVTNSRYKQYKLRTNEGMDLIKIMEKIKTSDFLQGKNERNWKITFDWLLTNDKNWLKIMEDNYTDKKIEPPKPERPKTDKQLECKKCKQKTWHKDLYGNFFCRTCESEYIK